MSIATDSYCIQCYLRRNADLVRPLGTEEKTTEFLKKVMQIILDAPEGAPSPWYGPHVADLLHEMYGLDVDRFRQERLDSNAFVLSQMDSIRERVEQAEDPVYAGLQFAVLGNYLDFSALQGNVSFDTLTDMLDQALTMDLDRECYASLCRDLSCGKKLLYLTDNAGEIGFDRICGEAIQKAYPHLDITFCVRGEITQNDATREDAAAVGIPFRVIDNGKGNRVAGTLPQLLGEEARQAMDTADVILAKGMGNAETLMGSGYPVYYAFLVKCAKFVNLCRKPLMTPMLIREQDAQK